MWAKRKHKLNPILFKHLSENLGAIFILKIKEVFKMENKKSKEISKLFSHDNIEKTKEYLDIAKREAKREKAAN